jgi:hypothetical protein
LLRCRKTTQCAKSDILRRSKRRTYSMISSAMASTIPIRAVPRNADELKFGFELILMRIVGRYACPN